jgi:hypothetical protein
MVKPFDNVETVVLAAGSLEGVAVGALCKRNVQQDARGQMPLRNTKKM